jgi:tetratricopeptide (TPR) repeat protein
MGKDLDARSDQFAVGLIFYELLTGVMPFHAESAIASLVRRTQERAVPLSDIDNAIPPQLSLVVSKCLERAPDDRFASVQDIIHELEIWQGKKSRGSTPVPLLSRVQPGVVTAPASKLPMKWIAIGAVAIVLVSGAVVGWQYRNHGTGGGTTATQGPVTSLAIIPFYNASGDGNLNWMGASIAEALSSDIGHSAHLRMVSPDRLQQVLHDLGVSSQSPLDVSTLRRIADFTHADTIVSGKYEKFGQVTRISVTVHDFKTDQEVSLNTDVADENQLLASLEKLAGDLREKLASNPEILKELQAHSEHITTKSIPALKAYDEGTQLARAGQYAQAVAKFQEATTDDPNFAMAFSKLAQTYSSMGYDDKAEQASRRAVELSDNLPAQDRFRIEANHASLNHDSAKAIASYEQLLKVNPDDTDTEFQLARLYQEASNFDQAKKYIAKVLASDPKNVGALLASGQVDILAGNYQASLEPLLNALNLTIQFDNKEEKGSVLSALGLAYQYLDKREDALRNYQQALDIRKQIGDQRGVASTLGQLAQLQENTDPKAALQDYNDAIAIQRKIGDNKGLAKSLVNLGSFYMDRLGKFDEGLTMTNEALQLARDNGDEVLQATCLQNIGNGHFYKGEYQDALTYYQQAYQLQDKLKLSDAVVDSLHNLGDTNSKLGAYDKALDQYMKALEGRRTANDKSGIALESSDMGILFSAQGRYGAALKAQQEAVNAYQQLNDRSNLMISALAEYGHTLAAAGRADEGKSQIEKALSLADQTKNSPVEALNYQGDAFFYLGDYASARQQYEKALSLADKAKLRDQSLIAKLNLAKLDVVQGRAKSAIPVLRKIAQDADGMGLKAQSVEASVYLGQALLAGNQAAEAQVVLDSSVGRAEKLGLRVEQARAQYLLGAALAAAGKKQEAIPHYRQAVNILESISKEGGASRVLDRSDLKDVYRDAAKGYQGAS